MNINFKVPEEINEKRKALNLSWRDLLMAGLKAYESPSSTVKPSDVEPYVRSAVQSITDLWNRVKKGSTTL
jgi:hypothetical protein